ncbi:MAG: hypothetical protein A2418_02725 [Candidatus Brennerbacteria bacterium RIFOXYC1_FULL_41_11]|uniref:Uncharacterized protein n=1 Tax=Candidatus Brennerbacteria bacterium RIFOXYD1_FULL_41_16 TaxID=1797529 RepID=A0A1G1XLQ6_9BACT|nr:MAG: hypothetical protein A2391_02480 [Candidatus Brennerbacteria bacterium RIFOXYB1_FULL_41_13]OGY39092.1 MAG: hypothetical protein A2418_02725 [Candidatus Brennerbacteria bacterium RIFOXYC1_FULL_41_11]OGY40247.1 MAG: hypothetical protein A2570_03110 [Candidatus Brennerbacteria bacterium RIFOXYD1_FULL_41_16]
MKKAALIALAVFIAISLITAPFQVVSEQIAADHESDSSVWMLGVLFCDLPILFLLFLVLVILGVVVYSRGKQIQGGDEIGEN